MTTFNLGPCGFLNQKITLALPRYEDQDVILQLPGNQTIFNIDWIAVYNRETKQSFGHVIVPEGLNVPPSLVSVMPHRPGLPNCK